MSITIASVVGGYVLAGVAVIVLVGRLFYPNHHAIAIVLYGVSWIPFVFMCYQLVVKHRLLVSNIFVSYGVFVVLGVVLLVFAYLAWVLFPFEKSPLVEMNQQGLRDSLDDDLAVILTLERDSRAILSDLGGGAT
jgi:hypothetical protein